jgi:hypothetical protein
MHDESLDSLLAALKQHSKKHGASFYPHFHSYNIIRFLKLVKKGAKFSYNEKTWDINWDISEKVLDTE